MSGWGRPDRRHHAGPGVSGLGVESQQRRSTGVVLEPGPVDDGLVAGDHHDLPIAAQRRQMVQQQRGQLAKELAQAEDAWLMATDAYETAAGGEG